ncbi:HlyD family efflux transporter periplasmic adaptor subunit [Rhodoferax sp.]|uniref:efflux RND transporter periplasmic adaptor subunit n=1 Tax=Rhodoferax sp. TaxID=50421 RepID=UPI002841AC21|nr:HlyD family efflux transporter periplasmic adaptor subunit [Rhodoferax sp.]MDR3371734.1 HlyD family efflux transporter periplasmic adaptor subunit [Rhodoferax sp.]
MQVDNPEKREITAHDLGVLLDLSRRARQVDNVPELGFLAVNDSHTLVPYRQGALWVAEEGVITLSGVVQLEANAPYVQWLNRVCRSVSLDNNPHPIELGGGQLPQDLVPEWESWLPGYGLWLPVAFDVIGQKTATPLGGLLLARDTPWQEQEVALLAEWMAIWSFAWHARHRPSPWSWRRWLQLAHDQWYARKDVVWWKQRRVWWVSGVVALLIFPIRLTVLAPGELVPANPAVIRAPLEGVLGSFSVQPNQIVKVGQPLFNFDDASLKSKLEVAQQALSSAQAEYRQSALLAVTEAKYKGQLALLMGRVEERQAEADYLKGQLERAHILAPQAGMALFDDPSEWIGKPVATGERIMRIAAPDDVEVEAWLAVGDAVPLSVGAPVSLYLNASPMSSVAARVRYVAYDAVQRPDGSYGYRVRASLNSPTAHRVGLKGTAKLSGNWVPVAYWVLRRPVAGIRQMIGW